MTADNLLIGIRDDAYWRLLSDPFLAPVPVLRRDEHDLGSRVENTLKGLLKRDGASGKTGAAIVVHAFDISSAKASSTPNPMMGGTLIVECSEHVLKNAATAGGTGISAGALVARVTQLLGGMHLDGRGSGLRLAANDPVRTLALPAGQRGYEVFFQLDELTFATVPTVAPVTISETGGTVTMSCATPGAAIRYTLDGSYPGASNPVGQTYSAPFAIALAGDYEVRAIGTLADHNPSKVVTCLPVTIAE